MVVPSLPPDRSSPRPEHEPLGKEVLRRAALDARKAFVATLSDAERSRLEAQACAAPHLAPRRLGCSRRLCADGKRDFPSVAMEEARSVGAIVAFPAFDNPAKPFRFRAGDPLEAGPFEIMQPKRRAPEIEPDIVLVPLIAIDGRGTRLGRGKGHYDRALVSPEKSGARLIGVGWPLQLLPEAIPADEWDIPLDAFASPAGITWFKRKSW